jgi:hypothetical protein
MVALSRCTTETVQPYGDCIMWDSPSQPPLAMPKDGLEVGGRCGSTTAVPQERGP